MQFNALVISEVAEKIFECKLTTKNLSDLPDNEVLIRVKYSTLNFKDALSVSGNKGVTRNFPHTPGIDAAGEVVESKVSDFKTGDLVLVTSYDLGMNTSGGLAEYISVPAAWVIKLPLGLSLYESMINGTAGLTAAMSINALRNYGILSGRIVVTGASGGVGSMAVAMLAQLGYEVIAATGKPKAAEFLKNVGATEIIGREAVDDSSGRPILKPAYQGGIDTVGGNILTTVLKSLHPQGAVACCGLVASSNFSSSIFPFILRGNALFGVDSAECSMSLRQEIWQHIATDWKPANLQKVVVEEIDLEAVPSRLQKMLNGQLMGKTVVKI